MTMAERVLWSNLRSQSKQLAELLGKMKETAEAVHDDAILFYVRGAANQNTMISLKIETVADEERWR